MTCTIAGHDAIGLRLRRPRVGPWHVSECSIAGEHGELDQTVVTLEIDGVQWSGFVTLARAFSGATSLTIVGGAGGLQKRLEAQHYLKPEVETVVRAIVSLAGEALDDSSAIPAATLPHWLRSEGRVAHCLTAICDKAGLTWRVLPNGKIWVGTEQWTTIEPDAEWIDEDWDDGSVILAADDFTDLAIVAPGCTLERHRLEQVEHVVTEAKLRTLASISSPEAAAGEFLASIRREMDPLKNYPCKVVSQNTDGTLQLKPEDATVSGNGLNGVPIRYGLPGFEAQVTADAWVRLAFDNGDRSRPFAATWDADSSTVTKVSYLGGSRPFARVGDQIMFFIGTGTMFNFTGTVNGQAATGVMTVITTTAGYGIISTGNPKLTG